MYICNTDTGKIVIAFFVTRVFQEKGPHDPVKEKSLIITESPDLVKLLSFSGVRAQGDRLWDKRHFTWVDCRISMSLLETKRTSFSQTMNIQKVFPYFSFAGETSAVHPTFYIHEKLNL